MQLSEIRRFRSGLRKFERLIGVQMKACSCQVTLAQCLVLLHIDEFGQSTMGQLATQLRLDQSTLSRTVDGLVKRGLVQRLGDEKDRRVVLIRLSAEGETVCQQIHTSNDSFCNQVFELIPPSRRKDVIEGFETLVQAYLDHEKELNSA